MQTTRKLKRENNVILCEAKVNSKIAYAVMVIDSARIIR